MNGRACLVLAAALSVALPAHANGRYPLSNQLVVRPEDPSHIAVRATFGLVLSADEGKTWSWVCEAAAQFVNGEDPPIALTVDHSLVVSSSVAFTTSPDYGCNWALPESDQAIVDADVDHSQPSRVVAAASMFADAKYGFALRESLDNGATWGALGAPGDGYVLTLAVAPSQPKRVYVSTTSLTAGTPAISRTDDDGATWHPYALPDVDAPVPYIAAIDPMNSDRVYVRAPTSNNTGDVLLVSETAGATWKQILKAKGTLAGFALSPDGKQIAVGGPTDPVQLASTLDYAFSPVNELGVTCLTWTDAGIFACADQATAGFSVGLSTDEGGSFQPLFDPKKLTLQVCDLGTPVAVSCPNAWRGLAPIIGADPATPGYEEGGSSMGGSAGVGGASMLGGEAGEPMMLAGSSGTAAGSSMTNGGAGGTATEAPRSQDESSGCSVSTPAQAPTLPLWLGFAMAAVWLARRRFGDEA